MLLTASRSSTLLFQTSRFFNLKASRSLPHSLALRLRVAESCMERNMLPPLGVSSSYSSQRLRTARYIVFVRYIDSSNPAIPILLPSDCANIRFFPNHLKSYGYCIAISNESLHLYPHPLPPRKPDHLPSSPPCPTCSPGSNTVYT